MSFNVNAADIPKHVERDSEPKYLVSLDGGSSDECEHPRAATENLDGGTVEKCTRCGEHLHWIRKPDWWDSGEVSE